ncbi:MAG: FAD-binding oxidoreductase [Rhodospirillaceae bacterium]|nr:FAD-binding oxidoreductase [Rhodospirillaceae bacterium]
MSESNPISLWDHSAEEPTYQNPFAGDTTCDVAIIGGGFTGLSTALHAAEQGVDCHVLEAQHVGYGGSGRNAGLVNAGLWLPPQDVRAQLGDSAGSHLVDTLSAAPEAVFSLIEKHQIRCEATREGTIHAAHSAKGFADLARRADEWQRLGEPVDLLSREEAADKIGSQAFHGGLLDHRAGTINPMGYVRGLARAALGAGATISTGVTAQKLRREGDSWVVETDQGTLTAKTVVIGTNAYSDTLWPGLKQTFTIIHYFQLATKPLGDRVAGILREGQGLWDTAPIMFSVRRDAFGRLIVGSMGRVIGDASKGLSHRWALRMLDKVFPDLGPVEIETAWHGQIAMTNDHLPRIHRLADGLYTPVGYNGRGIGPGTMFGKAMAALVAGGDEADLPMPITDLKTSATAPIMKRAYDLAFTANQVIKSL